MCVVHDEFWPVHGMKLRRGAPAAFMGTRIMDCCLCVAALGSDLPMKIATEQRGSQAPVVHHFLPSNTYSSPLSTP